MEKQILNITNYDKNDIFWRDFVNLPGNSYKLDNSLGSFRVLFVFPTLKKDISQKYYPLTLGYLASVVRMNHGKAKILVQDTEDYNPDTFGKFDLICFYPMAALFKETMEMSEKTKKDHPETKICFLNSDQHQHEMLLCNPAAENFGRKMMEKYLSIDFVLIGEAEKSFIQLCDTLNKNSVDFKDISACLYKENGQVRISEKPIEPVNFEFLPFASRDYLEEDISSGINQQSPRVQASRGCTSPCLYCAESFSNITKGGRKMPILIRDISKFTDELKFLQEKYGAVFFNITDSSFENPGIRGIGRMSEFCNQVQERDIEASFKIHLRTESIKKMNDEFLNNLKYSGVDIIVSGIESPIKKELQSYRKIASMEESRESIKRLNDMGKFFVVQGNIMFTPILALEDLPKKIDFLKELNYGWDLYSLSNNILIYPGTAYHEYIKERGLTLEHDPLSPIIPFHFADERVKDVSKEISGLKIKHPELINLQSSIFDSLNVCARYSNKMNKHLHANKEAFLKFKGNLKKILQKCEDTYYSFFMDIIALAESGYSAEKADLIRRKYMQRDFLSLADKSRDNLVGFLNDCERKNLSIDKLYLKTWMAIIHTQVNTSGGKIER